MNIAAGDRAERVGPAFTVDGMLVARRRTRDAIRAIAASVRPGMVEEEAVERAKQFLVDAGMHPSWHPTRVRFGPNTTRPMKLASAPGVVLRDDDIFFLDIAPRVGACEGDAGQSFVVGHQPEYQRCVDDAERLFHEVRAVWLRERLTGRSLYAFAARIAKSMGWLLNADLPGHRIADFPHAAIHTGSLADFDAQPSELRWILEVHLLDPQRRFGAFYEDMLLSDEHDD